MNFPAQCMPRFARLAPRINNREDGCPFTPPREFLTVVNGAARRGILGGEYRRDVAARGFAMDGLTSPGMGGRPARPSELVREACDRFEADWRAGRAPRIEDYLAEAEPADRALLLGEPLALEREMRQRHGECPGAGEYQDRFQGHAEVI
jgi:hypothetical protein